MAWLSGRRNVPGPAEVAISLLLELRPAAEPRMSAGELRKAMMVLFDDRFLNDSGVTTLDMPATPERLWRAMRQADR